MAHSWAQQPFVLVTGGTGFLGSHIVVQLLDAGYRVRCTARALKARFLEEAHFSRGNQFEVVEIEDLAGADLTDALTSVQAVIHTAFPAPGSMESTELLLNGVHSTTNILRQAYELGIYKFVLTSSYLAVVGERPESVWRNYTFTDRDWSAATYDTAFDGTQDPAWVYAAAKKLAEAAAWDYARSRPNIDLASVIPTLLIGPFAPGHAILSTGDLSTNVLLQSLITESIPPRPVWPHFVDVRDAAQAHIQALRAPPLTSPDPRPSFPPRPQTPFLMASFDSNSAHLSLPENLSTLSLSDTAFQTPSTSPTTSNFPDSLERETASPQKRFIASGGSFTWSEVISHLRAARPDLASKGRLPDEAACVALPGEVAQLDVRWTGTGYAEGWTGVDVQWRDWRETVQDAVRDLEKAAAGLEESGWEELFEESDDPSEPEGVGG
ncbi:NAD(P)-binding protein [Ramaria rubella]|nr:NAD(P)-binding protein [Ramaria rubella]